MYLRQIMTYAMIVVAVITYFAKLYILFNLNKCLCPNNIHDYHIFNDIDSFL